MPTDPLEARQCVATSKRSGERCKRLASRGQRVCAMHGGKAPQALQAARVRLLEEDAARMVERLEGTPIADVTDLYDQIAKTGGRVLALVDLAAERVAALKDWTALDVFSREEARADLQLYERSLDRAGRFLAALARVDLEAKRTAIDERRADIVTAALLAVLAHRDLGLDDARRTRARELLAAELQAQNCVT